MHLTSVCNCSVGGFVEQNQTLNIRITKSTQIWSKRKILYLLGLKLYYKIIIYFSFSFFPQTLLSYATFSLFHTIFQAEVTDHPEILSEILRSHSGTIPPKVSKIVICVYVLIKILLFAVKYM